MPNLPMSKSEKYYDRSTGSPRECHQSSPDILRRGSFIIRDGVFEEVINNSLTDCSFVPNYKDEKYINKFEYHPFQEYYECEGMNLYERFASLDTDNLDSVSTFIKEFGFLEIGVHEFKGRKSPYRETLEKWEYEVLFMKILLRFIKFLSEKDIDADIFTNFKSEYLSLSDKLFNTEISKGYSKYLDKKMIDIADSSVFSIDIYSIENVNEYYKHIKDLILGSVQMIINEKIKNVHPALYMKVNGLSDHKHSFDLDEYWNYNTLLEAMYLMIYLDLLKDKRLLRCTICGGYFRLKKNERYREYCKECRNEYNKLSKNTYAKKRSKDEGLAYYDRLNKKMNKRKANVIKRITEKQYDEWLEKANEIKADYMNDRNIEHLKIRLNKISEDKLFFREGGE